MRLTLLALSVLLLGGCGRQQPPTAETKDALRLAEQTSGTSSLLIAVSAVDDRVVWVGGTDGTVLRTTDGGATWQNRRIRDADTLQFRDVHAVDADTAYALSSGYGDQSRIYRTTDGGHSWHRQFVNGEAEAFFNCMDFWDADNGLAFSDAVDGRFRLIKTSDGGESWAYIAADLLPAALPGEGGFAASGTCLQTMGDSTAWIGTGNGGKARILSTTNRGGSWAVSDTPIVSDKPASGITSLAFTDHRAGLAAGGIISQPDTSGTNVAGTVDGGMHWSPLAHTRIPVCYCLAVAPGRGLVLAAGPAGLDMSTDLGRSWTPISDSTYWGIGFGSPETAWAVGTNGRITRIELKWDWEQP